MALPTEAILAISETPTQALQRYTVETAEADGVNPVVSVYVVTHESQWDTTAVGDKGLAYGPCQFHAATFDLMKKEANMPQLQYGSPKDQILLMNWALAHNEGSQWTTYRRYEAMQ